MNILKEIHSVKMISAIKPIEGSLLYDFVTEQKPHEIVETGMGKSTLYFVAAMLENGFGRLSSVDNCDEEGDHDYTERIRQTSDNFSYLFGERIQRENNEKVEWSINHCDSFDFLCDNVDSCDVFMHDSKHTYSHLLGELNLVEQFHKKPKWFICHDSIHDFAQRVFELRLFKIIWRPIRRARHLEIFKRK